MSDPPLRTPADWLASILLSLSLAVDGHSLCGRLARSLARLILDRIRASNQRFRRIADHITAGTYVPRRCPRRGRHADQKPRRRNPLPQGFAWLTRLVPETAAYGSQLQVLFADAEMAALMAAAPAPLRRPLRSLCRMLGIAPPPVLEFCNSPPAATPEREARVTPRREADGTAVLERQAPPPRPASPPRPAISQAHGPPLPA